jgi:hypothetical protein
MYRQVEGRENVTGPVKRKKIEKRLCVLLKGRRKEKVTGPTKKKRKDYRSC